MRVVNTTASAQTLRRGFSLQPGLFVDMQRRELLAYQARVGRARLIEVSVLLRLCKAPTRAVGILANWGIEAEPDNALDLLGELLTKAAALEEDHEPVSARELLGMAMPEPAEQEDDDEAHDPDLAELPIEERRARAYAMRESGMSYQDIADAFGMTPETIRRYVTDADK